MPLGVFTVTGVETREDRAVIEAVDDMATAFGEAYEPQASADTALGVIRAICARCGVPLGDTSGITDIPVTGLAAGHTCREMLGLMAAVLGRNAHMDREGRLVLRWYAFAEVLIVESASRYGETLAVAGVGNAAAELFRLAAARDPARIGADRYYAGQLAAEDGDFALGRIECTVTRTRTVTETGEDGYETASQEQTTETLTAGSGTTGISLRDPYMTRAALDRVGAAVLGETYRPMTVTFYGDARIEAGDRITVIDGEGTVYAAPVMKVVHSWDGGVRTSVTAVGEPASGSGGAVTGTLADAVSRLSAELGAFKTLEAQNLTATNARLGTLRADVAQVEELAAEKASIRALEAETARLDARCDGLDTRIDVTASGITSAVSSTYETKTDAASKLGAAKSYADTRVSAAKSEIKQTTDAIESTVSTKIGNNEVISRINQSAESVRIAANKIILDGTAIMQIVQAAGISADWITAGAMTVTDGNGNVIFSADKGNANVRIGGWSATASTLTYTEEGTQETYSLGRGGASFGEFAKVDQDGDAQFRSLAVGVPNPYPGGTCPTQITGTELIVAGRDILGELDGVFTADLLWTNPSPTASMTSQAVTISTLSSYDLVLFVYKRSAGTTAYDGKLVPVGAATTVLDCVTNNATGARATRTVSISSSAGTVTFGAAYSHTPGGSVSGETLSMGGNTQDNGACIPVYIYGIKV